MQHEETKKQIKKILGEKVNFEGHFNKCFDQLKPTQKKELLQWIQNCKEYKINPIQSKNKEIIGFIKKIGSNTRALLTKQKKGYFIAIFLDKHKYYETELNKQGF